MATKARAPQGMDSGTKIKLGAAVGLLVIAGAYMAYTMFGGGDEPPPPPPQTVEEIQKREVEIQEAKKATEEMKKRPGTVEAGE